MQQQREVKPGHPEGESRESGEFLMKKAVFLMTSSVGAAMAEALVRDGLKQIGATPEGLAREHIGRLAGVLQPRLSEFVGNDKAAKLTSALRVLVGGISGI